MRNLFPGFYEKTDEELNKLWQNGIFVFDTNMLLNVYRYSSETRNRYFEILRQLQEQLWIPYQVAYEYQDNRLTVIQEQIEAYKKIANILHTTSQNLESSLEHYERKHGFINVAELTEEITDKMKHAKDRVQRAQEEGKAAYRNLKMHDTHREQLECLFQDKIGRPYTNDELEEVYKFAKMRVELQIPPGWKDENKRDYKAYGDTTLWIQILDHARSQKKPIIFITDDGKKDWWLSAAENQGPIRPLPYLVQEMFVEAGVLFHMYQGYEFIEQAGRYLRLEEKPSVIEEAKEITQQNKIELNLAQHLHSSQLTEKSIVDAILNWIAKRYQIVGILESYSIVTKYIAPKKAGGDIWIGIELSMRYPTIEDLYQILDKYRGIFPSEKLYPSENLYPSDGIQIRNTDELIIFCVFFDEDEVISSAKRVKREIAVPKSISIVFGFLRSDGQFIEVDTL